MERQHSVPILLSASSDGAQPLEYLTERASGDGVSEAFIRDLVHRHPACLPITEIDAMFSGTVSICTELNTPAGPIDVFIVTPSGLPVLVECKLWRNPEARREAGHKRKRRRPNLTSSPRLKYRYPCFAHS